MFIAGLFMLAADELAEIADAAGRCDGAARVAGRPGPTWRRPSASTAGTGSGSAAPTTSSARPVGSAENEEGQIYIEPQGMCVMAGIGLDDGMATAGAGVRRRPAGDTARASCSSQPPYTRYHLELGEISSYPPGYKENGGIFCHTNPWIMIAETRGRQRRPGLRLLPADQPVGPRGAERRAPVRAVRLRPDDRRPDAPTHGEAKNSWLTGTAAWNFVAITQCILGIRPDHDGLRVDPCLPTDWEGFTATRRFRGATYHIGVRKPRGVPGRVSSLVVDGERLDGNLVPRRRPGRHVTVEAVLED